MSETERLIDELLGTARITWHRGMEHETLAAARAALLAHIECKDRRIDDLKESLANSYANAEALARYSDNLRAQLAEHQKWFKNNAGVLAAHRIGGFSFDAAIAEQKKT